MIALLKVYETLYQNDELEILYVMIKKSTLSDHFVKSVLLSYNIDNIANEIRPDIRPDIL